MPLKHLITKQGTPYLKVFVKQYIGIHAFVCNRLPVFARTGQIQPSPDLVQPGNGYDATLFSHSQFLM